MQDRVEVGPGLLESIFHNRGQGLWSPGKIPQTTVEFYLDHWVRLDRLGIESARKLNVFAPKA